MDFKLCAILLKGITFCWGLKFVDCHNQETHEVKCPTKINEFTVDNHNANGSVMITLEINVYLTKQNST